MSIDLSLIGDLGSVAIPAVAMAFHPCAVEGVVALFRYFKRLMEVSN